MKYLSEEELRKLTPPRRAALHKKAKALVGALIDEWFDFGPGGLSVKDSELNNYRKLLRKLVNEDIRRENAGKRR